jgi:hypothetical protein
MKNKKDKKKLEFSKLLLVQESALMWVITLAFIALAFVCVKNQFFGELPWITAMCALPWTAYGASQAFYYKKSEKENIQGGIKYDTTMEELRNRLNCTPCDVGEEEESVG